MKAQRQHSPTQGASGGAQVLLELALELSGEVVDQALIEVLTTQVGVTSGGLHLEDTLLNGQQGHIEGATTLRSHNQRIGDFSNSEAGVYHLPC